MKDYEEFAVIEIAKNNIIKQEKIRSKPSLNNHFEGLSIGKNENEHDVNKLKDNNKEDKKDNEEDNIKLKSQPKFHNSQYEGRK